MKPLLTVFCPSLEHRNFVDQASLARMREAPVEFLRLSDNDCRSLGMKTKALIGMARADWVCGMGDDDILHPQFFEKILPILKRPVARNGKLQMIGFNIASIGDRAKPELLCKCNPALGREPESWDGYVQQRPYALPCPVRKSLFDDVDWLDASYGEDHHLINQVGRKIEQWEYIDKTLYYAFPLSHNPDRKHWSNRYDD